MRTPGATAIAALVALGLTSPGAHAQEAGAWSNSTEFSFVRTDGNAESATLGVATTLTRAWERTELKVEAGGIRTRSIRYDRVAIGSPDAYRIEEQVTTETSAENYNVQLRLDRRLSGRTTVFVQSGWKRNTFAGVRHRLVNVAGVSTRWIESEQTRFQTAYGLTETVQRDVVEVPDARQHFVGVRLSSELSHELTDNTVGELSVVMDGNGRDWRDVRADANASVSVSMNEHLGLKTALRTTFDYQPALARLALMSAQGEAAGDVLVPREKLDRVFTVALVVTF